MSSLDSAFQAALNALSTTGRLRATRPHDPTLLNVSGNDYLGLSQHPLLKSRAADWAASHGTGAGASRLVTGTLDLHTQVEARLAALKGTEAALLFASGWQANASALAALLRLPGPDPLVFTDALNHASLHHGIRAAGRPQITFQHNDMDHLAHLLATHAHHHARRFIVTESVFSMDGDQADLPALQHLSTQHGAFLYLDEAHATGVLGPRGMGLSADTHTDLAMGTFSKALGSFGAYIAGSRALCDWLTNRASGFIHTTALPPPILGAIDAALELTPTLDPARTRLHTHATRLRTALSTLGANHGPSTTQIVPIILGPESAALALAAHLRTANIAAIPIRPPTVPEGTSRIRIAVSAAHTDEEIERLIGAIKASGPF